MQYWIFAATFKQLFSAHLSKWPLQDDKRYSFSTKMLKIKLNNYIAEIMKVSTKSVKLFMIKTSRGIINSTLINVYRYSFGDLLMP